MPAGDLLTEDFDHEVNGYLIGFGGQDWIVEGLSGWIGHTIRPNDVDYSIEDGGEATLDTKAPRIIRLRLANNPEFVATIEDAWTAARALEAAWVSPDADVELHAQFPEDGHVKVVGRCGDLEVDEITGDSVAAGELQAFATFRAMDPEIVDVP